MQNKSVIKEVKHMIRQCLICKSIDPAPVKRLKIKIEMDETWKQLGLDITHYNSKHCLSQTDCALTQYTTRC